MSASRTDFLARIADDRRRRIAALEKALPAHELKRRLPPARPAGRLERALRRGTSADPVRLVCEIKRASPSRGVLKADLDPVATAELYERGGAAAISIVTEPDHFQGELAWVDAVRARVRLPLLLKDFVFDSYQLLDAAARGADGVLLIAALLLGLDCLVEVHGADELRTSLRAGATLVGINNRDLHSFEVRLDTAVELLPAVPRLVTAVAESGYSAPADLAPLRSTRCDAALIGEVFMTSADPGSTLASLTAAARG